MVDMIEVTDDSELRVVEDGGDRRVSLGDLSSDGDRGNRSEDGLPASSSPGSDADRDQDRSSTLIFAWRRRFSGDRCVPS